MNTEIFRKAVRDNKGVVKGGIGGISVFALIAVVWPFVSDLKDTNAAQWRAISEMRERIVVLETKLEVERLRTKYEQVSH